MIFGKASKAERIERDVSQQADRVSSQVEERIKLGEELPLTTYAWIKGLSPEDTARQVGQAAMTRLDGQFMLDAERAEHASELTRGGAFITFVGAEEEI